MRLIACALAFAAAFVTSARAQTEDWARVVEAARKEGEVLVWGQAGDDRRKFWKDSFEKAYPGIVVRLFQPGSTSERDTRFLREFESGVAKVDVLVSGSAGMNGRLRPSGALRPLRPLLRPEVIDGKNWVDGEPFWTDPQKEFIIVSDQPVGAAVIANMSIPADAIKSWNDLLDPKYDGKIISLDPRQSGQMFALSLFLYYSRDLGPDYVGKLFRKGRITFTQDQRQIIEWVESGRMSLAFGVREPEIAALEKVGGEVRVFPALEANGKLQSILVGADGAAGVPNLDPLPHPNATRVYLNWFFSKEGQQAMVNILGVTSTHTGVDMSKLSPRLLRAPGAQYTSANDDRLNGADTAKAMRDTVTRAIEGR